MSILTGLKEIPGVRGLAGFIKDRFSSNAPVGYQVDYEEQWGSKITDLAKERGVPPSVIYAEMPKNAHLDDPHIAPPK